MAAYIIVDDSSISLGMSVTVTAYGLTSGTSYSFDTEYSDGTAGSWTSFRASDSSKSWSFTPTKIGYVTIILSSSGSEIDSLKVMVGSGSGGGGTGDVWRAFRYVTYHAGVVIGYHALAFTAFNGGRAGGDCRVLRCTGGTGLQS